VLKFWNIHRKRASCTLWIGGWVSPRAGLNDLESAWNRTTIPRSTSPWLYRLSTLTLGYWTAFRKCVGRREAESNMQSALSGGYWWHVRRLAVHKLTTSKSRITGSTCAHWPRARGVLLVYKTSKQFIQCVMRNITKKSVSFVAWNCGSKKWVNCRIQAEK
jgi:hypothetical protein